MDPNLARAELIRGLQLAYSGELGAVYAYLGHRAALRHGPAREAIATILKDEIRHRRVVLEMLTQLGSAPVAAKERKLRRIGRLIGFSCRVGGYFIPMYGAGRLESDNIVEYEIAARLAFHAGHPEFVDDLLHLAEVEWDHESVLRGFAASHWLWKVFPSWDAPPARNEIRARYEAFAADPHPVERRTSWLVR